MSTRKPYDGTEEKRIRRLYKDLDVYLPKGPWDDKEKKKFGRIITDAISALHGPGRKGRTRGPVWDAEQHVIDGLANYLEEQGRTEFKHGELRTLLKLLIKTAEEKYPQAKGKLNIARIIQRRNEQKYSKLKPTD